MLVTLFSQEIFGLMTSHAFYKGYLLVPLIMVGVIMTGQNVIFGGVIIAEKNTKIMGLSTIIGAVINIIFNLTFIPIWGSMAAAASVAISYFAINFLLYYNIQMKEKSIKSEFLALAIFSVTNFLVLIFFKFELSLKSVIIKSFIYFAYLLAMCLVYQFKLKNIRLWLRAGI
jgi:O-antigen/teichoic acid export membrane protein